MNNPSQNFQRALSILNSLLIFVVVLCLVEKLNLSYLLKFNFIFIFLIIGALKIYCMSGISGCLLEIISEEQPLVSIRRIHQNALHLWPGFLIVFTVVRLADFLIFALLPSLRIWHDLYFSLLATISAFLLAQWTINKKYVRPSGILPRKFKFKPDFLLILISACLLGSAFAKMPDLIHAGNVHWQNISAFMLNYIYVFEFIFCTLYILDGYTEITGAFTRQKEIFLINPVSGGILHSFTCFFLRSYPPIFVVLKALSPKTYKFREFNRLTWRKRYYKNNVLVCITCFTSNCCEAYKIAKEFRKKGAKVVMGGPHVTYLPNEALEFCDSVVIGPAEGVWKDVLRDYEKGDLQSQYQGPATEADHAQIHAELLTYPAYIIKDFLETTRGCKFRCHFCTIPSLSGEQIHIQPVGAMVELIKKIRPRYRDIFFIDNNIYADPGYAKKLFAALKPLKIKWRSSCSIDIAQNQETLKLARESGCTGLLFGYEISGESLERNQGGKFALAQKYLEYTRNTKKAGISIKGHFMFGFDSDNLKTLLRLWKFCFSVGPQFTVLSMLTPFPGSGTYQDMLEQNRIINLNWRNYNLTRLVMRHPQMDPALVSFCFPFIQAFFLITTSSGGFILFVSILVVCLCKVFH